jgi:hypothetical protein
MRSSRLTRRASGVWVPQRRTDSTRAMQNVHSWMCLSEIAGVPMSANELVGRIRRLDRKQTFLKLARFAAVLANSDGGVLGDEAKSWTADLILSHRSSVHPVEGVIADFVAQHPGRAIGHEQVVHFLQSAVLLEGADSGDTPHDAYLAFLMLAANDHAHGWQTTGPFRLSVLEEALADFFSVGLFNRSHDPLRELARASLLMKSPPARGPLSEHAVWHATQEAAFGCTFTDYLELFLAPLYTMSRQWGTQALPLVRPTEWLRHTVLPVERALPWFGALSLREVDARGHLAARRGGRVLPHAPLILHEHPFTEFDEGVLVAATPELITEQLLRGTWGRCNQATKRVLKNKESTAWHEAFGDLFEGVVRSVALDAARSEQFSGRLVLSANPGDEDEVEDVVVVEGDAVILFSAKASVAPPSAVRVAKSQHEAVQWLEKFFFEQPKSVNEKKFRGGALRILDKKITRLRSGAFEDRGISRDAKVIPVIVPFEGVPEGSSTSGWT